MAVPTTQLPHDPEDALLREASAGGTRLVHLSREPHRGEHNDGPPEIVEKCDAREADVHWVLVRCAGDGKEHVQNNPCHPVQEVLGVDAAHVEDAAHHDGHWQQLCAMIRGGSGRQLSTITVRRRDRSRNTTTMSFRATMKVRGTRVKKEWRYLRPPHHVVGKNPKCNVREEDNHNGNGEGHLYPNHQTHDRGRQPSS